MTIETVQYILPAYLGCALINNDGSNLSEAESEKLTLFIDEKAKEHKGFYCVNCSDEVFFTDNHEYHVDRSASDCLVFTFQINIK